MLLDIFAKEGLLRDAPRWLAPNCHYLTLMGSSAYDCSDNPSDRDVVGVVVPAKEDLFPHLSGYIPSYEAAPEPFTHWVRHHVPDPQEASVTWDFTIYGLPRFVHLLRKGTIGIVEPLFAPRRCVLHTTRIGEHLRDNRKLFLHKQGLRWLRHYAAGQLNKIATSTDKANEKRRGSIEKFGFDVKDASHVVRLYQQAEQMLLHHDLDLELNGDRMRAIRRGEWSLSDLHKWVEKFERTTLLPLLESSSLPEQTDDETVRRLLVECLEMHYGSLGDMIRRERAPEALLDDLRALLTKHGG